MGRVKEALYDIAEVIAGLITDGIKPDELNIELREILGIDKFEWYLENEDIVDEMVDAILTDDDEPWTDPAGGTHQPGEDPAAMYEGIAMPSVNEFFGFENLG